MATKWAVGFPSILAVISTTPENAELGNPRGERAGELFYAAAEDASGNRRTWGGFYRTPEEAEAAFEALAPPVELWEEIRPRYGSEAYVENWQEYEADEIALEIKEAEAEAWL